MRAAGLGGAHKASSLALALANACALALLHVPGLGLHAARPKDQLLSWVPKTPLFGLSQALHEPERLVGPMTAALLLLGTIPILLFTPDAPRSGVSVVRAFGDGARSLWRMLRTVGQFRDAAIFLVARSFYVDGMTAVLTFFGIYATGVMKWGGLEMLVIGIILTVLAVLGGAIGALLRRDAGPPPGGADGNPDVAPGYHRPAGDGARPHLLLLALRSGGACADVERTLLPHPAGVDLHANRLFQRAVFITAHYASSRTLLTRLTPPDQTGAFFGAYAVSGTATVWLAPLLVNIGTRATGSQQAGSRVSIAVLLAVSPSSDCCSCARATATSRADRVAGVPLDDRGLLLSDGLFETLLWRAGGLILAADHARRMTRLGAAALGALPAPALLARSASSCASRAVVAADLALRRARRSG